MQRTSRLHFFDRQDGKFRPNSAIVLLIVFKRETAAMKRSKSVKLVAMGTGLLLVAACEEAKVDTAFVQIRQTMHKSRVVEQECVANFQQAQQTHIAAAPKYTSQADCEADFGAEKCELAPQRTTSGGSVFMPLMAGYMMGSMLSGGGCGQPLYRGANSTNFRTADNKAVGSKTGRTKLSRRARPDPGGKDPDHFARRFRQECPQPNAAILRLKHGLFSEGYAGPRLLRA